MSLGQLKVVRQPQKKEEGRSQSCNRALLFAREWCVKFLCAPPYSKEFAALTSRLQRT